MTETYEPVFLPNESITAKKHKVGDMLKLKITEVMDDGVKAVCSHGEKTPDKEMAENTTSRYKAAMEGGTEGAEGGY